MDKKNIEIIKNCCGCSACEAACMAHAITMKENEDGFIKAYVNEYLCVNCGKCLLTCPIHTDAKSVTFKTKTY